MSDDKCWILQMLWFFVSKVVLARGLGMAKCCRSRITSIPRMHKQKMWCKNVPCYCKVSFVSTLLPYSTSLHLIMLTERMSVMSCFSGIICVICYINFPWLANWSPHNYHCCRRFVNQLGKATQWIDRYYSHIDLLVAVTPHRFMSAHALPTLLWCSWSWWTTSIAIKHNAAAPILCKHVSYILCNYLCVCCLL